MLWNHKKKTKREQKLESNLLTNIIQRYYPKIVKQKSKKSKSWRQICSQRLCRDITLKLQKKDKKRARIRNKLAYKDFINSLQQRYLQNSKIKVFYIDVLK